VTRFILASKSASRAAILKGAGVDFAQEDSHVDEAQAKRELAGLAASPRAVAEHLAEKKALAVSERRGGLVIGCDQTLDLDGALFDKAEDMAEARVRLMSLRGRRHHLHAALAAARAGEVLWRFTETVTLTMRLFSEDFLEDYLARAGHSILGSVGCYRLEGEGANLFEAIDGDYFAILGLPLLPLLGFLRREGVIAT